MEYKALLNILLQTKIIEETDIATILKIVEEKKESIITAIVKFKKIDYATIANVLSLKLSLALLDLDFFEIDSMPQDFPVALIDKFKIIPIKKNNNGIVVAVANPLDNIYEKDIKFQMNLNVTTVIVEENKLLAVVTNILQKKGVSFAKEMNSVMDDDVFENVGVVVRPGRHFVA